MARAFSSTEREEIGRGISAAAYDCFSRYGYRKTTMEDVARAAGIAKGTVYLFHGSKSDLFATVAAAAEAEIRERIVEATSKPSRSARDHLIQFLRLQYSLLVAHPLLWIVSDPVEAEAVFRDLTPAAAAGLRHSDDVFFDSLLKDWRMRGLIGEISPATFAALLRGLYVMNLRRDLIGESEYEGVVSVMITALATELARGATKKSARKKTAGKKVRR